MESIFQHGNWKKEKGLTLIEVVIALTITVIISVAVVSVSIYSSNALYKQRAEDFFIYETSNIATIYYEYDEVDYVKAINHLTGLEVSGHDDMTIYYKEDFTYSNSSDYHYYLNVKFNTESLTFDSYNSKDVKIYSRSVSL